MLQVRKLEELRPRLAVLGVGGAGSNAVANMIRNGLEGVEFVALNTDAQALRAGFPPQVVQLGRVATEGLGAGSCPALGRKAAEEAQAEIQRALAGFHMCFIAAGLGGGTGTGAAPVVARLAREAGLLTVAVVTLPFAFEGKRRARIAAEGLSALERYVDTLIVMPNQNLFRLAGPRTTLKAAFELADDVLHQGIRGLSEVMLAPGFVNLDLADVRAVLAGGGRALFGTGEAKGVDRAASAAEKAISDPLLDEMVAGARGLLISIAGGHDMRLIEVDEAVAHVTARVDPEAEIIWGSSTDEALDGRIRVSVVATGLPARATHGAAVPSGAAASSPMPSWEIVPGKGTTGDVTSVARPDRVPMVPELGTEAAADTFEDMATSSAPPPTLFERMAMLSGGAGRLSDASSGSGFKPRRPLIIHEREVA